MTRERKFKLRLRSLAVVRTYVVVNAEGEDAAWEKVKKEREADFLWDYSEVVEGELECEGIEVIE